MLQVFCFIFSSDLLGLCSTYYLYGTTKSKKTLEVITALIIFFVFNFFLSKLLCRVLLVVVI